MSLYKWVMILGHTSGVLVFSLQARPTYILQAQGMFTLLINGFGNPIVSREFFSFGYCIKTRSVQELFLEERIWN